MSRIYGNIGFRGLWNGLPVRIGMIGTLSMPSRPFQHNATKLINVFHSGIPMVDLRFVQGFPWLTNDWRSLRSESYAGSCVSVLKLYETFSGLRRFQE